MEIDDISSDTETIIYSDEDIDSSNDEITENNWRYNWNQIFNNIHENKLNNCTRPLDFNHRCQIQLKNLPNTFFTFPLSNVLCSRMICEYGIPLNLSNKYEFCGTKVVNTAWQIDNHLIDFPLPFLSAIRSNTFEQLHLNSYFDLHLHKLMIFGPCSHTKMYNFDDTIFMSYATIIVFLPSNYTGGNYRFIDQNLEATSTSVFNQHESNNSKAFIIVVPTGCDHEIEPIEKGFKILLVYHLVTKSKSIDELYSLLWKTNSYSTNLKTIFEIQQIQRIFSFWKKNVNKMPTKLIIPLQHPLDDSPYFSYLFREKYRIIFELIISTMKYFSSFLIYSATFQMKNSSNSIFIIRNIKLLNSINEITINLDSEYQQTVLTNEFLGELDSYVDAVEESMAIRQFFHSTDPTFHDGKTFHVLVLLPYQHQWNLILDDPSLGYHHLSYMLSLPISMINNLSLDLFNSLLHNRISSFDKLLEYLILLRNRIGLTKSLIQSIKFLFQNKQFKEELFFNSNLNHFIETFSDLSLFLFEFLNLFRKAIILSMPTKLNEIVKFLLELSNKTLRCLFINILIRFIFKRRAFPRHILLSTLCSIFYLLILDESYSNDCLIILAYNIIKRIRKNSSDNEIIEKCLKIYLIPMIIKIYREKKNQNFPLAFVLIYEFCLNMLNYYCSTSLTSSFNIISINEALLICSCQSCSKLQMFLIDSKNSTLMYDLSENLISDHCLRHTLNKFPMLSMEYKHDPCTGRAQTLIISKCFYEQELKQLCYHLRRLLIELHKI
ncbi:unnamed protein product [Rotaria sordida]|uniref:Prolyl 4-hydroxylase alpha subunit Fe(2+) 2OG dioxygenase domain-containing protein n=2 Tax=Rotaria sordida TaxID=392033 RepID=A0A815KQZ6_9BILA|nr:unnamed protein product [Rotaria sordida]